MMSKLKSALCLVLLLLASAPNAQTFEDAMEAFNRKDFQAAFKATTPLAQAGDLDAQGLMAHHYMRGLGLKKDFDAGLKWARKAAENGGGLGQQELGFAYLYGTGVPQDYQQAFFWLRRAADKGLLDGAMYNVAKLYFDGTGVAQNTQKAYYWMKLAALGNHSVAIEYAPIIGATLSEGDRTRADNAAKITNMASSNVSKMVGRDCFMVIETNYGFYNANTIANGIRQEGIPTTVWGDDRLEENTYLVKVGPYPSEVQVKQVIQMLAQLERWKNPAPIVCSAMPPAVADPAPSAQTELPPEPVSDQGYQSTRLPVFPVARGSETCAVGYTPSGDYCLPGPRGRYAVAKGSGMCPNGYLPSGDYCLADVGTTRLAIPNIGNCPVGYMPSGSFCLANR